MRKPRPKPGDLLCALRSDTRLIVGHYLSLDSNGPLVHFYECPVDWTPADGLGQCTPMFDPVYCGTDIAVRKGLWTVIGHIDPPSKIRRRFVRGGGIYPKVGREPWSVIDDGVLVFRGETLPAWAHHLELDSVFSAPLLADRFETGDWLYTYENLMKEE